MKKNMWAIIAVCILAVIMLCGCGNKTKDFSWGKLEVKCVDGSTIDSEFIKSHDLTVLNVWATYCNPCIEEMPILEKISKEDPDHVAIVGLLLDIYNSDGTVDEAQLSLAKDIIAQTGATYPTIIADDTLKEEILDSVKAVPMTYFLDSKGNIIGKALGGMNEEKWKSKISEYLKAAK